MSGIVGYVGGFFGRGADARASLDRSRAPYTVVASGLTLPAQHIEYPFSLVTDPVSRPEGAPEAAHELVPAWVLAENLIGLEWSAANVRARHRGQHLSSEEAVFRPEVVDLMWTACRRLEAVCDRRAVYTERHVPGLGKNFLREVSRRAAVTAYHFHVRRYALLGLLEQVRAALAEGEEEAPPAESRAGGRWEHQRRLLRDELGVTDAVEALRDLLGMLERHAREVERSRARAGELGVPVSADDATARAFGSPEAVIRQVWERTRRLQRDTLAVLAALGASDVEAGLPHAGSRDRVAFPPPTNVPGFGS
jgi:hypothetical protein